MAAFLFRLETADGAPAEPPTLTAAVPNWRAGATLALGAGRTLLAVREDESDELPVRVVEDMAPRGNA